MISKNKKHPRPISLLSRATCFKKSQIMYWSIQVFPRNKVLPFWFGPSFSLSRSLLTRYSTRKDKHNLLRQDPTPWIRHWDRELWCFGKDPARTFSVRLFRHSQRADLVPVPRSNHKDSIQARGERLHAAQKCKRCWNSPKWCLSRLWRARSEELQIFRSRVELRFLRHW